MDNTRKPLLLWMFTTLRVDSSWKIATSSVSTTWYFEDNVVQQLLNSLYRKGAGAQAKQDYTETIHFHASILHWRHGNKHSRYHNELNFDHLFNHQSTLLRKSNQNNSRQCLNFNGNYKCPYLQIRKVCCSESKDQRPGQVNSKDHWRVYRGCHQEEDSLEQR